LFLKKGVLKKKEKKTTTHIIQITVSWEYSRNLWRGFKKVLAKGEPEKSRLTFTLKNNFSRAQATKDQEQRTF
jgi:hypothetical protein